ncbi:hypothetical protein L198_03976 [Cryptococcus wingfieldii CBS 7118]|uniref:Uncharacterized protein n=1 Tax=Cryptococcus wingfieldii CBS 7118 TaxID=1295528 RepID=A0A1E3J991_9TREE|nr:hypothetical protein L198_03976 [Cryptococcus wingfieldii CBS 7118]ODN97412.1 hypothetical protein L198_03976 [Cryptococcus wingfieldii CBS 7118]
MVQTRLWQLTLIFILYTGALVLAAPTLKKPLPKRDFIDSPKNPIVVTPFQPRHHRFKRPTHAYPLAHSPTTSSFPPSPIEPDLTAASPHVKAEGWLVQILRIFSAWHPFPENQIAEGSSHKRIRRWRLVGSKRPMRDLVLVNDVDGSGRRLVDRGGDLIIQEPQLKGFQWRGAEELDDETDEPYYWY